MLFGLQDPLLAARRASGERGKPPEPGSELYCGLRAAASAWGVLFTGTLSAGKIRQDVMWQGRWPVAGGPLRGVGFGRQVRAGVVLMPARCYGYVCVTVLHCM